MLQAAKEQLEAQRRQESQVKNEVQDARAALHDATREESRAAGDAEDVCKRAICQTRHLTLQRDSTLNQLRNHTEQLQSRLSDLESLLNSGDIEALVRRQGRLMAAVEEFNAVS